MSTDQRRFCTSAVITGLVALSFMFAVAARADDAKPAPAADSPEALKEQIKLLKPPEFDAKRRDDEAYRKQYKEAAKKVMLQRAELMARFDQQYPDNPDTVKMRYSRWANMTQVQEEHNVLTT